MNLEKSKQIFHAARIYSNSAYVLNSSVKLGHDDLYNLMPSQVVAGLALELYLKCIYYIDKNQDFKLKNRQSHDFDALFNELDASTKGLIISKYNSILETRNMIDIRNLESALNKKIDVSFISMLQNWNGIFVKARYFYENEIGDKVMVLFPELEDALINCIISKVPDLKYT
jgi:hypothetical protein